MAGMLPGVECARRRRLHQNSAFSSYLPSHDSFSSSKRSFCLYERNVQSPSYCSSLLERIMLNQGYPDEDLGGAAREAKQRLDQKFAAHLKLENQRFNLKRKQNLFHGLWQQLRSYN